MSEHFAKGVGRWRGLLVLAALALLARPPLAAQEAEGDQATERDRLEALEQEVTELHAEIERLKRATPQAGEPAPAAETAAWRSWSAASRCSPRRSRS